MKKYFYILLIIVVTYSCNDSKNRDLNSLKNELSRECIKTNPLNIQKNKLLGEIGQDDTLILFAEDSQLGEFDVALMAGKARFEWFVSRIIHLTV